MKKSLKYFPKAIRHTFLYLKRRRWIIWRPDKKINEEILNDDLNYLREKLIDNLKDVYKPFKEDDPIFITKGKKPLMKINTLMETEPNQIYWKEILEGSFKILPRHKITSLQKFY